MQGKYTIKEIEERSGVAAATLRQWERRYGFPRPQRSSGGYRLFSDDDLANIVQMQAFVAKGVPPSRAAQLVRETVPEQLGGRSPAELAAELGGALRALDAARAERILSEAHAVHTFDDVLLAVIAPAMMEIGDLWHAGEVNVATEHFASQFIQGRLRLLLTLMPHSSGARRALVACAPGELHELGALIVAIVLSRQGFDITYLGQATPLQDLAAMANETAADAVLISASLPEAIERLREERVLLRSHSAPILFGGRAFEGSPEAAEELGGVFLGNDLVESRAAISQVVGSGSSARVVEDERP